MFKYIFKKHSKTAILIYRLVFAAFIFVGAVANINVVWLVADCFNAMMALPNLVALFALANTVRKLTDNHFAKSDKLIDGEQLDKA